MFQNKLVDMELDDEAKLDAPQPYPMPERPDYPYGLRISLTEKELKKLGIEPPENTGDTLDFKAHAVVTSVSRNKYEGQDEECVRVELQIQKMAAEE